MQSATICIDWGTSRLRSYLVAPDGAILDRRSTPDGIMVVARGGFPAALDRAIGAWRRQHPEASVVMSGMVGSRQGWREAPYADCPAGLAELGARLVELDGADRVHIVPGIARRHPDGIPDVMRGEECQVLGAASDRRADLQLFVLPGTHSKWVLHSAGRIVWFATFMTGEVFGVLYEHSILGRLMAPGDGEDDAEAFIAGVERGAAEPGFLLRRLFSARTLGLFDEMPRESLRSYLSGLLIGAEIREAELSLGESGIDALTVIGAAANGARYRSALEWRGYAVEERGEEAAVLGMLRIAEAGGLR